MTSNKIYDAFTAEKQIIVDLQVTSILSLYSSPSIYLNDDTQNPTSLCFSIVLNIFAVRSFPPTGMFGFFVVLRWLFLFLFLLSFLPPFPFFLPAPF